MKKCNCSQLQWTSNILLNQQLIKWKGLETSIDHSLSRLTYGFTEVKDCECQDMINITCDVSRTDNSYRKRLIVKLPLKKFFLISFHMIDKATQFYLSYKLWCCTEISPEKSRNNTRKKFSSSFLILIICWQVSVSLTRKFFAKIFNVARNC